jgi:nitroimidazol reductase NimA-like FMN-containing flavoprotein (pyridoxamine 5'-phosphate oxidase superfamily)
MIKNNHITKQTTINTMKYVNDTVRRQDRLMDEERALQLLESNDYGILSMVSKDGTPYGIPVNYVFDGKESIFIHCAPEGKKLQCIENNPDVSFCIIGEVHILPEKFTTEYESVVFKGKAHIHLTVDERRDALHLLVDRLSAEHKDIGYKYVEKSFHRVDVIRVDFNEFSGKCKHVKA